MTVAELSANATITSVILSSCRIHAFDKATVWLLRLRLRK